MENLKLSCEACRDLLPLYADGVASGESAALVESHLAGCEDCRAELDRLKEKPPVLGESPKESMLLVKHTLRRKRLKIALFVALGCVAFFLLLSTVVAFQVVGMDVISVGLESANAEDPPLVYVRTAAAANSSIGCFEHFTDKDGNMTVHDFETFNTPPWRGLLFPPGKHEFGGGYMDGETEEYLKQGKELRMRVYEIRWADWEQFERLRDKEDLFDNDGRLLPKIANIAKLVWEGPVQ